MVALLKEFRDSFAWDYDEMPGLDRKLIEHRLPIKEGFKPYKQPPRRMAPDIIPKVKEEVERLLRARFHLDDQPGMSNGSIIYCACDEKEWQD